MVSKEQINQKSSTDFSINKTLNDTKKSTPKISPLILLAQTCDNIGKEFYSSNTLVSSRNGNIKNSLCKKSKNDISNKSLISIEKMTNRFLPQVNNNNNNNQTINSNCNETKIEKQHNLTSKIVNNKNTNRTKPYTTPNKTLKPTSSSSSSSTSTSSLSSLSSSSSSSSSSSPVNSISSSPTSATSLPHLQQTQNIYNTLNIPTSTSTSSPITSTTPAFDPLFLTALQKYYATLAAYSQQQQQQQQYDPIAIYNNELFKANALGLFSSVNTQQNDEQSNMINSISPNLKFKTIDSCTIPGCTQCSKHLNVSTTPTSDSNTSVNVSLTTSPLKITSPQTQHSCNWLNGGNILCGKKFSTIEQLNEHLKTHTTAELVSDLSLYYNIRSSLLNNNSLNLPPSTNTSTRTIPLNPLLYSSSQSNQLHSNRVNPYSKTNSTIPHYQQQQQQQQQPPNPYNVYSNILLANNNNQLPNFNYYSQLALLSNNI